MGAIAIIPARGGSKRIPMKNIKPFHGKPIIAYSIDAARKSGLFDQIWVSTDSKEIADVAEEYGALFHIRPDHMAHNDVGTQEVMRDAIEAVGTQATRACCIYPCAPMMHAGMLVRAELLLTDTGYVSYVVPIGEWLQDPGMFYFGQTAAFKRNMPLISPWTRLLQVAPGRCVDINTPEDWARAEVMYAKLQGEK